MDLFDTHAHLNFPDYEQDYTEAWQRAKDAGLVGLVNVGTDLSTSKRAIEIAHELDLSASVGIHPNDAKQFVGDESWKRSIEEMVADERVVAIGETGLDLYRQAADLGEQESLLEYFLDLARRIEKPVLFHCRNAYTELLELLTPRRGSVQGVVHAFGGDERVAKKFLDLGFSLSFTAQVTYPKNHQLYAKLLPTIPLDHVLLETDCPFLPPEGLRGQRNEPRHVDTVAGMIGKFLDKKPELLAEVTTKNALDFFGLSHRANS